MKESHLSLSSRLARIAQDLDSLDIDLKSGEEPEREVLEDFRKSVDEVRNTAWTIGELMNARAIGEDRSVVLSFLAAERMRRFSQMVRNLAADIDDPLVTWETGGIQRCAESLAILQARLGKLLDEHRGRMKKIVDAGD
ncbi:MAG TPA: hypothetical protein VFL42_11530 [Terriglobales bacterium]|jgi:hypothetical protein|nr:hypothetical protein [Terriglobales bacterium]